MIKGSPKKIVKLKKLIREKKFLERQEELDKRVMMDSLRVQKEAIQAEPKQAQVERIEPPEENPSNPEKPESLNGFSIGEIMLMEADGWLNETEQRWFETKRFRINRRYIPSLKEGWMR